MGFRCTTFFFLISFISLAQGGKNLMGIHGGFSPYMNHPRADFVNYTSRFVAMGGLEYVRSFGKRQQQLLLITVDYVFTHDAGEFKGFADPPSLESRYYDLMLGIDRGADLISKGRHCLSLSAGPYLHYGFGLLYKNDPFVFSTGQLIPEQNTGFRSRSDWHLGAGFSLSYEMSLSRRRTSPFSITAALRGQHLLYIGRWFEPWEDCNYLFLQMGLRWRPGYG